MGEPEVEVRLADPGPGARPAGVRLLPGVGEPRELTAVDGGGWVTCVRRAGAERVEYLLELRRADGTTETVCDPGNPRRARGPFGDMSVLEFPGYRPPGWLDVDARPGVVRPLSLPAPAVRGALDGSLWTSPGGTPYDALPLLVVHDGPEFAALAGLTRFLDVSAARGAVPPMRAALLAPPGDRGETYSASASYARALTRQALPALAREVPVAGRPVLMGASLGGLAALHAQRRAPGAFAGLVLQSGSFFTPALDGQESGFARFERITRFTADVRRSATARDPVPVAMSCGAAEENLANNRLLARSLAAQGHAVAFVEHPDAHNWTSWRDVLDPLLPDLLRRAWPGP